MPVLPIELQSIASHGMGAGWLGRRGVHRQQSGGLGFGLPWLAALVAALFVAGGTGAGVAEPRKGPSATMPVLPVDLETLALGEQNTHLFRCYRDAGQRAVVFCLARRMFLVDKTNAFVANSLSLQMTANR